MKLHHDHRIKVASPTACMDLHLQELDKLTLAITDDDTRHAAARLRLIAYVSAPEYSYLAHLSGFALAAIMNVDRQAGPEKSMLSISMPLYMPTVMELQSTQRTDAPLSVQINRGDPTQNTGKSSRSMAGTLTSFNPQCRYSRFALQAFPELLLLLNFCKIVQDGAVI